jgi:hypothetical protein
MSTTTPDLTELVADLDPADLRHRIAELDRQRSALAVLLRSAIARQLGRRRPTETIAARPEVRHGD